MMKILCRNCHLLHRLIRPQEMSTFVHNRDHAIKSLKLKYTKTAELLVDERAIRNIGIIAHIDAGKTTTTEKILYLVGAIKRAGTVDSGDTVTDFMEEERNRGITIQSAAISFYWKQHRFNLIDTPGHVDFTLEVERCLRVLDGTLTVLDGSAGVEAQTLTVWKQATKFALPSVVFVNKMDKPGASFPMCLDSIEKQLEVAPLTLFRPLSNSEALLDVLGSRLIAISNVSEKRLECETISKDHHLNELLINAKEDLYGRLADLDEQFAEILLISSNLEQINPDLHVRPAIRRTVLTRKAVVVTCGSAVRNRGIYSVLDLLVDYSPSPQQRCHPFVDCYNDEFCALVFKITHDRCRGPLTFIRVYSGECLVNMSVFNVSRRVVESNVKVHIPHSDQLQNVDKVTAGNIAVLSGLKWTITGDTLVRSEKAAKMAAHLHHQKRKLEQKKERETSNLYAEEKKGKSDHLGDAGLVLAGIDPPEPVYFCSIEPPSTGGLHNFEKALLELTTEDPSLRIRQDPERRQTILEGMGQLHIEITKERLKNHYGLDVFISPLQIAYRERIGMAVENLHSLTETVNDQKHHITLEMSIAPNPGTGLCKQVMMKFTDSSVRLQREWIKAINEGCQNALFNGPIIGFPVHDISVSLTNLTASGGRVNPILISACANLCLSIALKMAKIHILEPIMMLEIAINSLQDRSTGVNGVLRELSRRRAQILHVDDKLVHARAPLAELFDFSSALRIATSGLASVHMQLDGYHQMNEHEQNSLLTRINAGGIL